MELWQRGVSCSSGLASPFGFTGGAYPGGGTCQNQISSSCSLGFAFTPTAPGPFSATYVLQYNDGTGNTQSVSIQLSGTGIAAVPAVLTFNPSSYDFGSVTMGVRATATLQISRTGNLNASSLSVSGPGGDFSFLGGTYPGAGGTCGSVLPPTATSCTIVVAFTPSTGGARGPQLVTLGYYDGTANQQTTLTLNGTGSNIAVISFPRRELRHDSDRDDDQRDR